MHVDALSVFKRIHLQRKLILKIEIKVSNLNSALESLKEAHDLS